MSLNILSDIKNGQTRLDNIDILRGIAIFGVIAIHTGIPQVYQDYPFIGHLLRLGKLGVHLFFVISAFSLCYSFEIRGEHGYTLQYFIRRFFRLVPLYYAVIFYILINRFIQNGGQNLLLLRDLLMSLTFTHGLDPILVNNGIIGVEWILTVEVFFYLIFPILYRYTKKLNIMLIVAALISLISLFVVRYLRMNPYLDNLSYWNNFIYFSFIFNLPIFMCGMLAFTIWKQHFKLTWLYILSIILMLYLFVPPLRLVYLPIPTEYLYGVFFAILILMTGHIKVNNILGRMWILLGRVSYSAYLVHLIALGYTGMLINNAFDNQILSKSLVHYLSRLLITLVITVLISAFTYKFIEIPGARLGNFIIRKFRPASRD